MSEVDLLKNHSKTKRNLSEASILRTDEVRLKARKFDKDFSMEEENINRLDEDVKQCMLLTSSYSSIGLFYALKKI